MMSNWKILLLAVSAFAAYQYTQPRKGPPLTRATESETDPCYKKAKCVVVYIAPWCPACEASIGTLQEMNRLWNPSNSPYSHGIKVIVGRDDPAKCKAKAEQVGAFASVDTDDRFSKRHKIEGFPTWLVFNAQGDEIKRVGAAFPDAGQADLIAREVLKL